MRLWLVFFLVIFFLGLSACQEKSPSKTKKSLFKCRDCHHLEIDASHDLGCPRCHQGKEPAPNQEEAHQGLRQAPASPAYFQETCEGCHPQEVSALPHTLHFTLSKEMNAIRQLFDLPPLTSVTELKEPEKIETKEDLVNDLLRRRCLRCHLFDAGDDYPETKHGLGCAACHLFFAEGKLQSHLFTEPNDRLCLHCHYGNRVGWDYYGMAEHDYPYQFRSPLIDGELPPRPWGIEFHELSRDVHLEKAGMSCLSCHGKEDLMFGEKGPSCLSCHQPSKAPYHTKEVLSRTKCSVCHARWAFSDKDLYLVLHEAPDWEEWSELMVQGSSEVEEAFLAFLTGDKPQAVMRDKFSGKIRPGLWLLTLKRRRFEEVHLTWDKNGSLSVARPMGHLYLSYVNAEEEVLIEHLKSKGPELLPYSPHTIGRADFLRTQKVLKLLEVQSETGSSP